MKRTAKLARTSITLPQPQLAAADRIAETLDRSRSWVFAEAIRRWSAGRSGLAEVPPTPVAQPRRPADPALPLAMDPAGALRLSPAARLQRSQELTAEFRRAHPRAERIQVVAFGTQEDFLHWKWPA